MERKYLLPIKTLLLAACIFSIWSLNWFYWAPTTFDEFDWRDARLRSDYRICYKMRGDLLNKILTEKPAWGDLKKTLGEPDYQITPVAFRYRLKGPWYSIFPDDSFILIIIEGGRVADASVNKG